MYELCNNNKKLLSHIITAIDGMNCVLMVMMPLYPIVPNKGLDPLCDGSFSHWLIGPIFLFLIFYSSISKNMSAFLWIVF